MQSQLAGICLLLTASCAGASLTVRGNSVFDGEVRVKFKGIGLTCTEYMTRKGIDEGEYVGRWAYHYCFGGPSGNSSGVELNEEPENVLRFLQPDINGGSFQTQPSVQKVAFPEPYGQVVLSEAPEARPITRVPLTGSLYLHEAGHAMYRDVVDRLVEKFTSKGVAVILDLHWNCPDISELQGCAGAQKAPMALRHYGGKPGSLTFWEAVSKRYANNGLVLYELFNEPWVMQFGAWYYGSKEYAGMKEMYEVVRKNDPKGLVIIGGKDQFALDAQSGLAFHLQYRQETGRAPTNLLWNVHPYVGLGQGLEHSLESALRIALALKTIGPVIFTEFGQYCCGGSGAACDPAAASCSNRRLGAHFVHNLMNVAEQYDLSWVGWGWRGAGVNNVHRPCMDGMSECSQPDMRDRDEDTGDAVLSDGRRAGADWSSAWAKFASNSSVVVEDVAQSGAVQPAGFLPRPCITDGLNLGDVCGWSYGTNVSSLSAAAFSAQSIFTSILPGLPGSCEEQGCPGYSCARYAGPCQEKAAEPAEPAEQPNTTAHGQLKLDAPASTTPLGNSSVAARESASGVNHSSTAAPNATTTAANLNATTSALPNTTTAAPATTAQGAAAVQTTQEGPAATPPPVAQQSTTLLATQQPAATVQATQRPGQQQPTLAPTLPPTQQPVPVLVLQPQPTLPAQQPAQPQAVATVQPGATAQPAATQQPLAAKLVPSATAAGCSTMFAQCGGRDWMGPTCCQSESECKAYSAFYSQCTPAKGVSVFMQKSAAEAGHVAMSSPTSSWRALTWAAGAAVLASALVLVVIRGRRSSGGGYGPLAAPLETL